MQSQTPRHVHDSKTLGTYGIHVTPGLFSCSMEAWLLALSIRKFAPTINHQPLSYHRPLSASHNFFCFSFLSEMPCTSTSGTPEVCLVPAGMADKTNCWCCIILCMQGLK